ncbi:MBL fold metallo-hydrolase [Desulfobacterales bacterium HSG17]|nr:MBL fold metallo-hydrolase [Desulfobacterales bacterium HSG17]
MNSIQEVAPGIFRIRQTLSRFKFLVNIYLLAGEDGLVFDSGFGSQRAGNSLVNAITRIADRCETRGHPCTVTRAMTSHGHWDHFSGLAHLKHQLGLEILATERQALKISIKQNYRHFYWGDLQLFDAQMTVGSDPWRCIRNHCLNAFCIALLRIRFVSGRITRVSHHQLLRVNGRNWEVLPVPGHCDDDIALFNRETGILLGGDLVFRGTTTWMGPMKSDLDKYLQSLTYIRQLPGLKLILPAHGSPITDPRPRLTATIEHLNKRTAKVLQFVLAGGPQGVSFDTLYQSFFPGKSLQRALLGGWIVITLKHLLQQREITLVQKGRTLLFQPATQGGIP